MTDEEQARDHIADIYAGFFGTWIINVGLRSGLLEALRERGASTAAELAASARLDPRLTETWCRGAYAFGVLDRDVDRFALERHAGELLLDATSPSYMGGRAVFFPLLAADFEVYPDRLRDGGRYPLEQRPWELVSRFRAAAKADAPNAIANVLPQTDVVAKLRAGGAVLDAGAGAGFALAAFAEAFPQSRLVGIEPHDESRREAEQLLGDQATITPEHVTEMSFAGEFDLVMAYSSISHVWGSTPEVFAALVRALRPGGTLLVSEIPYPEDLGGLRTVAGRMFSGVAFDVALLGHELLTPRELLGKMSAAGLVNVRLADQPAITRMMAVGRADV